MIKPKTKTKPKDSDLRLDLDPEVYCATEIPDIVKRIILNVEALEKAGKTDFALGAPGPIIVMNSDRGLEGPVQRHRDLGKQIVVCGMQGSDDKDKSGVKHLPSFFFNKPMLGKGQNEKSGDYLTEVAEAARPAWRAFRLAYLSALRESSARSIVCDNGGSFWDLCCYARFGKIREVPPRDRALAKSEFSELITIAEEYDKNVIWTHRLVPEWVGNESTGKLKPKGYSEMPFDVHSNVRISLNKKNGERKLEIRDCRLNGALVGEELDGDMVSFPTFAAMVFGNDPEEWE